MTPSRTRKVNSIRQERIEVRVTAEQKALFLHAAELTGRSMTELILTSAEQIAQEVIRKHQIIHLSIAESRIFADALLHPQAPNTKLLETIARYQENVSEEL